MLEITVQNGKLIANTKGEQLLCTHTHTHTHTHKKKKTRRMVKCNTLGLQLL